MVNFGIGLQLLQIYIVWYWSIAIVDIYEILNNLKTDYLQKVDSFITHSSNLIMNKELERIIEKFK